MMRDKVNKMISTAMALVLVASMAGCKSGSETPVEEPSYAQATVSFLGPEGTYTQEACELFFNGEGAYVPYETVGDAVQALSEGTTRYAVIPQENTIGGAVIDYLDVLIAHPEVSVVGEVVLPISQNLLVLPGASLADIKTVYSHKQGIAQGREWLSANLPNAEVIEVSSTAEGARMVSEAQDPSCAAIASVGCADVYGLEVLASGIQNNSNNKTRFYVLSTDAPGPEGGDMMAFIASGKASDLPSLIERMDLRGMKLVTIHDRPLKTELGEYHYLIECTGGRFEDYLHVINEGPFECRYLGCFVQK